MANSKNTPSCPSCKQNSAVTNLGKGYVMYPAGCVAIAGLFTVFHQAQLPVRYKCEDCEKEFKIRSIYAKIALFLSLSFVAFIVLIVLCAGFTDWPKHGAVLKIHRIQQRNHLAHVKTWAKRPNAYHQVFGDYRDRYGPLSCGPWLGCHAWRDARWSFGASYGAC